MSDEEKTICQMATVIYAKYLEMNEQRDYGKTYSTDALVEFSVDEARQIFEKACEREIAL